LPPPRPAEGIEALANTRVIIRPAGKMAGEGYVDSYKGGRTQRSFSGSGADEDIVVSSARAYVRCVCVCVFA
jgi:2-isopropylmalate synthase